MLKLIYYVPESHLESTKQSIFAAGAGGIGTMNNAWQVKGIGQFKPVKGADPYIGELVNLNKLTNGVLKRLCLKKRQVQWQKH
jgi:hypothetical protein